MMGLKSRIAIVTGAAQGIGKAIALRLAREGMCLTLADIQVNQTSELLNPFAGVAERRSLCKPMSRIPTRFSG